MASLRFPFLFSQPIHTPSNANSRIVVATTAALAVTASTAAFSGVWASQSSRNPEHQSLQSPKNFLFSNHTSLPMWASISVPDDSSPVVKSRTGISFPSVLNDSLRLLGIGMRKKSVLGLKNIDVYAFGVYADDTDIKNLLREKYGQLSVSELKENKMLNEDLLQGDICMTIRLQIVYGKLNIRSVRSAFEESVGNRLQKFSGSDNKELLQRFTSQFKDEYKIPKGSVIELSRDRGQVLRTKIDGKEVGNIQSKLLCQSILDLYIGEDPFDRQAKEDIALKLASLQK